MIVDKIKGKTAWLQRTSNKNIELFDSLTLTRELEIDILLKHLYIYIHIELNSIPIYHILPEYVNDFNIYLSLYSHLYEYIIMNISIPKVIQQALLHDEDISITNYLTKQLSTGEKKHLK
jgi:hypothetical protein